jgi:hypothetical protein
MTQNLLIKAPKPDSEPDHNLSQQANTFYINGWSTLRAAQQSLRFVKGGEERPVCAFDLMLILHSTQPMHTML